MIALKGQSQICSIWSNLGNVAAVYLSSNTVFSSITETSVLVMPQKNIL